MTAAKKRHRAAQAKYRLRKKQEKLAPTGDSQSDFGESPAQIQAQYPTAGMCVSAVAGGS